MHGPYKLACLLRTRHIATRGAHQQYAMPCRALPPVLCRRVKMTRLRLRVAERLKGAQNTYAMLTTFNEVDMTGLMEMRSTFKVRSRPALAATAAV